MKRLLLAVLLLTLPLTAFAQWRDRDDLLTEDGTLFTIESVPSYEYPNVSATSSRLLALTVQKQGGSKTVFVPESLQSGSNTSPVLAYDSDSGTLFIFWERGLNNHITSNLLFTSYQNGKWSAATSIENADFHWCHNLRVGVTRKVEVDVDGKKTMVPGLTVHAIWWDYNPRGEWARYAMLPIEKGTVNVADIQMRELSQFFTARDMMPSGPVDALADDEVLRHPQLFESASHESVDVIFGDMTSNAFRRVTLRTGSDGRLRVPLGVRGGTIGSPRFKADSSSRVSSISSPGSDKMVLYTQDENSVRYVTFSNDQWSPARSIAMSDKITAGAAVDVIRRMVWDTE